jgi:dihydrofolate reductase
MILATDLNGCIGVKNKLPWHLPSDFKWFKEHTIGRTIVMGNKTWESLPIKPLPNRVNVVLSRTHNNSAFGEVWVNKVSRIEEFMHLNDAVLIGGATIYTLLFHHVTRVLLTKVHLNVTNGDSYFDLSRLDGWSVKKLGDATDGGVYMEFFEYCRS